MSDQAENLRQLARACREWRGLPPAAAGAPGGAVGTGSLAAEGPACPAVGPAVRGPASSAIGAGLRRLARTVLGGAFR